MTLTSKGGGGALLASLGEQPASASTLTAHAPASARQAARARAAVMRMLPRSNESSHPNRRSSDGKIGPNPARNMNRVAHLLQDKRGAAAFTDRLNLVGERPRDRDPLAQAPLARLRFRIARHQHRQRRV